jgi:hypothetical protein
MYCLTRQESDNGVVITLVELPSMGACLQVHKHVLAATYQLHAFHDAAAMAIALNRTLILPKVWAWCDSDHAPTIMATCAFEGAEQTSPWHAPGDLYFNMDVRSRISSSLLSSRFVCQWGVHVGITKGTRLPSCLMPA